MAPTKSINEFDLRMLTREEIAIVLSALLAVKAQMALDGKRLVVRRKKGRLISKRPDGIL